MAGFDHYLNQQHHRPPAPTAGSALLALVGAALRARQAQQGPPPAPPAPPVDPEFQRGYQVGLAMLRRQQEGR